MPLDPEFKAKWIADLRSGKHKQTRHALHQYRGGYRCLGRAYEVAGVKPERTGGYWYYEGCLAHISTNFMNSIGLTSKEEDMLMGMNDFGKTFAEIADYIEQNL